VGAILLEGSQGYSKIHGSQSASKFAREFIALGRALKYYLHGRGFQS